MEEITVFEIPDQEIIVNKSQKQLVYENLELKTKIDKHHVRAFYEMDEYLEKQQKPKSTLISIMLKWITQYCMPVTTKTEPKYSISLQNDTQIYGFEDGKYVAIPTGVQFKVVGLKLPALFIKNYSKKTLVHYDHISDKDLSLSGHFGLLNFQTYQYTQQRDTFTHPGLPVVDGNIIFENDKNTSLVLTELLKYIDYMENYYNVNFPIVRYDLIKPDVEGFSYSKWLIVNGVLTNEALVNDVASNSGINSKIPALSAKTKNNVKKSIQIVLQKTSDRVFNKFMTPVLEAINSAQNSNFGSSFYYDILYMLEKNGLIHAYNIADLVGLDDNTFKKEINAKKTELSDKLIYEKQVYEGYGLQSDIIKKKTIAFDKYGEYELAKLDKKQQDVVELEFKKLNAKTASMNTSLIKLFSNLRTSFLEQESGDLKKALHEIEEAVSAAQLNGFDLLDSGLCPHIYNYGKKLLENFNKPWAGLTLRQYMINTYALPEGVTGYFCKICGEKISDADNTSSIKLFGERSNLPDEDPTQIMIWKEAMYIISNNVRFLTPMPIKPLVNSLSSGLRNVILEEEAKLYRSKTSSGESIKDTLNLYAAIYIYAALCALMLSNPGKMMFAREKSSETDKTENYRDRHRSKYSEKSNDDRIQSKYLEKTNQLDKPDKSNRVEENRDNQEENRDVLNDNADVDPPANYLEPGDKETADEIDETADQNDQADDESEIDGAGYRKRSNKHSSRKHRNTAVYSRYLTGNTSKSSNLGNSNKHKYIRGGKAVTDVKLAEKFYLNTALKLILLSKEAIISRLRNMSIDVIKQIFLKNAYTWAVKHAKPIKVGHDEIQKIQQNYIIMDPFYEYTYYAKRLGKLQGSDKYSPGKIDDVKGVLGREESDILEEARQDVSIFDTVSAPSRWYDSNSNSNSKSNSKSNPESGTDNSNNSESKNSSDYQSTYHQYTYDSYMSILEYVQQQIYKKSFIPRHIQATEYLEKWKYLHEIERKIHNRVARSRVRPNIHIELLNDIVTKYNNFAPSRIDLAQHFCPSGELHKTDSYLYTDGKKEYEYSKKDMLSWLNNKDTDKLAEFRKLKMINERCGKCKLTIRDAKSTDKSDRSLFNLFKKADDIMAFYQYFETRCPKGNLHDFQGDKCTKCKMQTSYAKTNDKEYYSQYVQLFNKAQLEKQSISIKSLAQIKKENNNKYEEDRDSKYQYSLKKTAEWSQVSDVKYNILVNIGMSEGSKYVDIENSKINPSKTDEKIKTRSMKLIGYILNVLREYNLILNHDSIADIPLELKEIINSQKKTGVDITHDAIKNNMPIFNDFAKLNDQYKYSLQHADYANFLQEYLADIMLRISKDSDKKYEDLAKLLVKYFTSSIITNEKMLSRPEPVFAKVDITELEEGSEDELGVSGDDWAGKQSDHSEHDSAEEKEVETYENDINNEGFDVENADDIWENE